MSAGTSWCPFHRSRASMPSMLYLEQHCLRRFDDRLRGHNETIGERLERDLEEVADLCRPYRTTPATSTRRGSVLCPWSDTGPMTIRSRWPTVIGTFWSADMYTRLRSAVALKSSPAIGGPTIETTSSSTLSITCRSLRRRRGALDQAAPLVGWELPEEFGSVVAVAGVSDGQARKEGVRAGAQTDGELPARKKSTTPYETPLRLGAVSFDAVKHLVLCRIEGRPPRLDMELYPYLPKANVATTSTRDYMTLLVGSRS